MNTCAHFDWIEVRPGRSNILETSRVDKLKNTMVNGMASRVCQGTHQDRREAVQSKETILAQHSPLDEVSCGMKPLEK